MTDKIREQISAWIDDELDDSEASMLVRRLTSDEACFSDATRVLTIGQLMRGERAVQGTQFGRGVSDAIDALPTYDGSESSQPTSSRSPTLPAWLRTATGGGIAAAVAVLAINFWPGGGVAVQEQPSATVAGSTVADRKSSDNGSESFEYVVPATLNDSGLVSANPELAAYFISHSRSTRAYMPGNGRAGILASPEDFEAPETEQSESNEAVGPVSERVDTL